MNLGLRELSAFLEQHKNDPSMVLATVIATEGSSYRKPGAMMMIRELFSFIPSNNMEDPPVVNCMDDIEREDEKLQEVVPADPNKPYDIKEIINSVADDNYFFEIMPLARNDILL